MRLPHVDASTRIERSNSRMLTAYFIEQLRLRLPALKVDYMEVASDPLPHVSDVFTAAMYPPAPADRTEVMQEAPRGFGRPCRPAARGGLHG
jgi:FMN-dependent NADH-azoreductase